MGYASVPPGEAERRIRSRWKPVSLLYVELDSSNGGVVLNISETGLAMHAAQTVPQDSVSRLRFKLPPSRQEIVASGRIAWKGDTQKELGIRFEDLPESTRQEIRQWIQADSIPRKLSQKVRPFPLSRVHSISEPVAPSPASTEEMRPPAREDGRQAGYPTATAIAHAMRQAKDAEHAATPPASSASGASALPAGPVAEQIGRSDAKRKLLQPAAIAAPATAAKAGTAPARITEMQASPAAGRLLVPRLFSLDQEIHSASAAATAAQPARQRSGPNWGRRLMFGTAITLISFILGLAAGGRDLQATARELSAGLVAAWQVVLDQSAANQAPPLAGRPAVNSLQPGAAALTTPQTGKANPLAAPAEEQTKPVAPRPATNPSVGLRAAATSGGVAARGKKMVRAASLSAASSEDGSVPAQKALPVVTSEGPAQEKSPVQTSPAREAASGSENPEALAPSREEISGTVAVHSRLRSIRIPSELRFLSQTQGEGLQVGEMLSGDPPAYPQEALRERIEGTVSLHAVVGRDGSITSAEVVRGSAQLAAPSLAVVRGWRYEPTLLGGQAVEWEEDITVVFRLQNPSAVPK